MTDLIRRTLDMVLRVLVFLHANPSDDPAYVANLARLEADAARLQELAAREKSGHIEVGAAVVGKKEQKGNINDAMTLLSRLAVIATRDVPSMPVRLTIPKPHSGAQTLITGARVVVNEARAQQEMLTTYGMTTGFLDQVTGMIDQYEQAISAKSSGVNTHVGANAEMQEIATEIVRLVRVLDAVQRPRFRHDPEKRAAWKSARSIVRRTPKSDAEPAEPVVPTQPPKDSAEPAA